MAFATHTTCECRILYSEAASLDGFLFGFPFPLIHFAASFVAKKVGFETHFIHFVHTLQVLGALQINIQEYFMSMENDDAFESVCGL